MSRLGVTIAGVPFKNPVTVASGTFGFGREFAPFTTSPAWAASWSRA